MKILWKLTSRSRPAKMFRSIDNIRAVCKEKDPWIIVSMDESDESCNNSTVRNLFKYLPNVFPVYGVSKNKIDAINRDIPPDGWDIIVGTSDDVEFLYHADETIKSDVVLAYFKQHESVIKKALDLEDDSEIKNAENDFVIWYPDGAPHGRILTVPIMTRKYYNLFKYLYNPVYTSLFCDEEAIAVGEKLGKIYYSKEQILIHNHPANGKADWDAQYRYTDSFYHSDQKIFNERKRLGFPL